MSGKKFKSIGEEGLHSLLDTFKKYTGTPQSDVIKGIGDDAAVVSVENGKAQVMSSEILLEGIHFDLTYTPLTHLGYKAVTAAVSDIYAMNATPHHLLVNIAVANKVSVDMIEQLYKGIDAACKDYNVQVVGGDTTASHQVLAISVTATGSCEEKTIIGRNSAKEGELLCVTGDLGAALAGLRILMREKKAWQDSGEEQFFQPDLADYEFVVKRQLVPLAQKEFVSKLAESGIRPGAMTDLTKGLLNETQMIAKASGVGFEIYSPAVPIALETRAVADEMQEDVDKYAFYGGEDFEMLFTLSEDTVEELQKHFQDFAVVGKVIPAEKGIIIQTGEGESVHIDMNGQSD